MGFEPRKRGLVKLSNSQYFYFAASAGDVIMFVPESLFPARELRNLENYAEGVSVWKKCPSVALQAPSDASANRTHFNKGRSLTFQGIVSRRILLLLSDQIGR
jgi:hypothetical protein